MTGHVQDLNRQGQLSLVPEKALEKVHVFRRVGLAVAAMGSPMMGCVVIETVFLQPLLETLRIAAWPALEHVKVQVDQARPGHLPLRLRQELPGTCFEAFTQSVVDKPHDACLRICSDETDRIAENEPEIGDGRLVEPRIVDVNSQSVQ